MYISKGVSLRFRFDQTTVTNRCDGTQLLEAAAVTVGAGADACGTPRHSCVCTWAKSVRGCPPRPPAPPPACPQSSRVCRRNRCRLGLVVGGGGDFDDGVCVGVVGYGAGGDPRKRTPPIAACTLGQPNPSEPDCRRRRLLPECPVRRAICPRSWEADNSRRRLRKRTRPTAVCNLWPHATTPAVAATHRCNDSAWAQLEGLLVSGRDVVSFCDGFPGAVACSCGPTVGGNLQPSNLWTPVWTHRDRAVEIRKQKTPI